MLQLQLFSLQLMHRENIFSAKGFIVDATLLTAVSNIYIYIYIYNTCFRLTNADICNFFHNLIY